MKYKQLTITKRYQLLALKKLGYNQKEIAEEIGVHPSTICRELKHHDVKVHEYNTEMAQV